MTGKNEKFLLATLIVAPAAYAAWLLFYPFTKLMLVPLASVAALAIYKIRHPDAFFRRLSMACFGIAAASATLPSIRLSLEAKEFKAGFDLEPGSTAVAIAALLAAVAFGILESLRRREVVVTPPPKERPTHTEPAGSIYSLLRESGDFPLFTRWRELEQLVTGRFSNFIGREQILAEVDRRLAVLERSAPRSGTLVLLGEPGLGKTSLAAALAMRGYLHHFNAANLGITSREALLQNLCTQVILRFGLDRTRIPPNAGDGFGVLGTLLREVAAKSQQRIVIVIDALDEMEASSLPLGLPEHLPEGVFFVITSRPKVDALKGLVFTDPYDLDQETKNNRRDLQAYIEREISNQPFLSERLHPLGGIAGLLARSEGNFMYVVQILRHVGGPNFESLKELPSGLASYYDQHWSRMVGVPGFKEVHMKLLEHIATVGGPVTVTDLSIMLRLDRASIADALRSWAEFLHVDKTPTGDRYSLYHATFREFLAKKLDLKAADQEWHESMKSRFSPA